MDRPDLENLRLAWGGHTTRNDGVCFMEAVAWWADKEHTDAPPCVATDLRNLGICLNDVTHDDDLRQKLVPLIPLMPGTADDGKAATRALMAADWAVRVLLPHVAATDEAAVAYVATLSGLPRVTDYATARRAENLAGDLHRDHRLTDYVRDVAGAAERAANYATRENEYALNAICDAVECATDAFDGTEDPDVEKARVWTMAVDFFRRVIIADPDDENPEP